MNRTSYPSDLTDTQWEKAVIVSANTSPLRQTSQVGDAFISSTPSFMSSSPVASGECYPMICHRGKPSITISESGKPDDT